jgi:hypothetical protein
LRIPNAIGVASNGQRRGIGADMKPKKGTNMARPFKVLPQAWDWEREAAAVKLKPDKALSKALEELFELRREDQYDKRLEILPKILRLATDLKKSKEVIAAGPNAVKLFTELIDLVPQERKTIEKSKREFEENAAHKIDVQIMVVDWNNKPFEEMTCWAMFQSPGVPKVGSGGKLGANGFDINDVLLRPTGTLSLDVITPTYASIKGVTDYEFKPGKEIIKFKAVQVNKVVKVRAKTVQEATNKIGIKGSVGIEFSILKVGGEVTKESEYKKGFENEVEWEVEYGLPSFKEFKQI